MLFSCSIVHLLCTTVASTLRRSVEPHFYRTKDGGGNGGKRLGRCAYPDNMVAQTLRAVAACCPPVVIQLRAVRTDCRRYYHCVGEHLSLWLSLSVAASPSASLCAIKRRRRPRCVSVHAYPGPACLVVKQSALGRRLSIEIACMVLIGTSVEAKFGRDHGTPRRLRLHPV